MAVSKALQHKNEQVIAIIGDGAITGGMAYEAYNNNAGINKTNLLIVLNDNNISIDPNVVAINKYLIKVSSSTAYNKIKTKVWRCLGGNLKPIRKIFKNFGIGMKSTIKSDGNLFESLGIRYFGPVDGHNVNNLINGFNSLKKIEGPKILHCITKKGKGFLPAEQSQTVWHSPGKFNIETGERIKNKSKIPIYQNILGKTLLELAEKNDKIVAVSPAMISGSGLNYMQEKFPERVFDVGIAEQHAVTFSTGLAISGILPFCVIYSSFLIKKAKEKVKVRIIVDDMGSWTLYQSFFNELRNANIEIFSFLEIKFLFFSKKINNRNHRKIIVIDGKVGFTGGINIAKRYIKPIYGGIWRDTHVKIVGDAVKSLQLIFLNNWYFVSKQNLNSNVFYPKIDVCGNVLVQIAYSAPDSDWENIKYAFIKIFSRAQKYIYLHTPYFIPTDSVLNSLKIAALSNVDVKIIIPKKTDALIAQISSMSYIQDLFEAGVEVYLYNKGFLHSKAVAVDDAISTIGSTNFDFRSFEHNFEVNAFIYNKEIAQELKNEFENDLKISKKIDLKQWKKRPRYKKIFESFVRILSPLL